MTAPEAGPPALLHPFARTGQTEFVRIVSGRGCTLVDDRGREYLDAIASLWCVNVGHGRTEVVEAVHLQMQQLATYNIFGTFTNEPADRLAEQIVERAPMPGARVFFTNSGSESVDTALKLARLHHVLAGEPDRVLVVAREGGYHGTAVGGTSAQGIAANREGYGPLLDVVHVGRHDLEAASVVFAEHGERIAAVIAEPVQGASGVHPPVPGYLQGLRRLCDQHGALLIIDEVITGFGRLGTWFAAQHYGVVPDLVTFAKGVTSGYVPMGGVLVGPTVRASLESDPDRFLRTGFTYSGHPSAAAAGLACLQVEATESLRDRAVALGDRLGPGLTALCSEGLVADVRGVAAIWAVDLLDDAADAAFRVTDALRDAGVIVRAVPPRTLALCPPLVMTDAEVDRVVDTLAEVIARSAHR